MLIVSTEDRNEVIYVGRHLFHRKPMIFLQWTFNYACLEKFLREVPLWVMIFGHIIFLFPHSFLCLLQVIFYPYKSTDINNYVRESLPFFYWWGFLIFLSIVGEWILLAKLVACWVYYFIVFHCQTAMVYLAILAFGFKCIGCKTTIQIICSEIRWLSWNLNIFGFTMCSTKPDELNP